MGGTRELVPTVDTTHMKHGWRASGGTPQRMCGNRHRLPWLCRGWSRTGFAAAGGTRPVPVAAPLLPRQLLSQCPSSTAWTRHRARVPAPLACMCRMPCQRWPRTSLVAFPSHAVPAAGGAPALVKHVPAPVVSHMQNLNPLCGQVACQPLTATTCPGSSDLVCTADAVCRC